MSRAVYCDESIWIPVADGLRQRGWEVHTARGEGMLGAPDEDHLALAVENDWILFTFDDDFLSLVEGEGSTHAGVIFTNQAGKRVGRVVRDVDAYLDGLDPGEREIKYL